MEVTFWGVRGSIPAPGAEFNRYGGNTACVAVRSASGGLIILDAGTGITVLGRALMNDGFGRGTGSATILLTHAHWDHIQGFPFFAPVYVRGNHFTIYGPTQSPSMLEGILEGQMNPHFSPIHSLRNLGAEIEFRALQEGEPFEAEGVTVRGVSNPHGRYAALAYRLEEGSEGVVYAPDAGYEQGPRPEVVELYQGATLLIHDTTYTPEDQEARRLRGHSSILGAARAAALAGAATLVMFHYDQDYTDGQVDELERRCRELLDQQPGGSAVALVAAREGLTLRTDERSRTVPARPAPRR
jgi:phosphoribosyl 1,2-cyclic phosphodiesterase